MPYGKKPMMMKMGSKEKNTPMNFSEKAMKYMKAMPALYGKPKMIVDTTKLSAPKRKLVEGVAKSPKMYGKPMMDYGKPKSTDPTEIFAQRKKAEYDAKMGVGAAKERKILRKIDQIKSQLSKGATKPEVEQAKAKIAELRAQLPRMYKKK